MNSDNELTELVHDAVRKLTHRQMQRLEWAVRGAIRAGYDGVDVHYPGPTDGVGISSIEPWNYPEPELGKENRIERYSWYWFSNEELAEILTTDDLGELIDDDGAC